MREFNQVFSEHFSTIYKFCYGITGCSEEAQDIAQETFLRLFHQLKSGQKLFNPKAWIFRVAANLCYNALKRKKTHLNFMEKNPQVVADNRNSSGQDSPEIHYMKTEKADIIRQEISCLPHRHRILLMLYLEGFSYKEMAKMTGVKRSSVGVVISRAIDKLEKRVN
jgi:RNA polymerase sigma-70 factor (ECF subfamily)